MLGISLIIVAILMFLGLFIYIKKTENIDIEKVKSEINGENKVDESLKQKNSAVEENIQEVEMEDSENSVEEEEFEEYRYDSYKSDEEYLRMARLVKNIYYSVVGVVIVLFGILYIIMFKLN